MTVEELIAELDKHKQDIEVKIYDPDGEIYAVGRIELNKKWAKNQHCIMIQAIK